MVSLLPAICNGHVFRTEPTARVQIAKTCKTAGMILSVHHLQYGVLQAKLGNPAALVSNYKYTYPAEHFDVPVNVDPSLQVSAEGMRWYPLRIHALRCTTRWQSCTVFLYSHSPLESSLAPVADTILSAASHSLLKTYYLIQSTA